VTTIDDDLTPDGNAIEQLLMATEKQKFAVIIGTIKVLPIFKKYTLLSVSIFRSTAFNTVALYDRKYIAFDYGM